MMRRVLARVLLGAVLAVSAMAGATAQDATTPGAILTIDPEQLFERTLFGQRVIAESEELAASLQAENRRIEGELSEEERDLTERRPSLTVEEFRALADAFDEKVNRIRMEQDAKVREVQSFRDTAQQRFLVKSVRCFLGSCANAMRL